MNMFNINPVEVIAERSVQAEERPLSSDDMPAMIRKIIIGIHTYGINDNRLISFTGLSRDKLKVIVEGPEIQEALKEGRVVCWTKAEIIARLAVEADNAPKASERILALTKLMEYRGLAAPEGGARGFERIIQKFNRPNLHQLTPLCKDLTPKLIG